MSAVIDALIADAAKPVRLFLSRYADELVEILAAAVPGGFKVEHFPDSPKKFDLGSFDGAVIVQFRGRKYGKAAPQLGAQQSTVTMDIHVLTRGLLGQAGAYDMLELVRLAVQGRRVAGALPIECVDDGLVSETDGIWNYALTIRASAPAVSQPRPTE